MNRLPTLFVSHGAPDYALAPGLAGAQLSAAALELPRPKAVLIISPHWTTRELRVSTAARPATIHDFGGFDPALYDLQYPVNGHPILAQRALDLLQEAGWPVAADESRGLDHGAWVPLRYLYPDADVPVFQVSMPASLQAASALALGRALAPLADEGVLIVGSGSLTHNLYEFRHGQTDEAPYARQFTAWIRDAVQAGDAVRLSSALQLAPHALRAHPSSEHFLPLLIAVGAAQKTLPVTVLPGGIRHGVLSMESYVFGRALQLEIAETETL
ncbi:MAG: class III extradiol ring-cleavage dioxygenase [Burkholderiales bacterium]|nr:class III extradiol ring-cleavage dioxygenase [Burkholderiales bacterium]